jgi:hypothetical protein
MAQVRKCSYGRDMVYQTIYTGIEFVDPCRPRLFFVRNHILSRGACFCVVELANRCVERINMKHLVISRSVEIIGENCFGLAAIRFLAPELHLCLRSCGPDAFSFVRNLSILFILDIFAIFSSSSCRDLRSTDIGSFQDRFRGSVISARMFCDSPSLNFICIPSTLMHIGKSCFSRCQSLSTLSFESNSKLDRIEGSAFSGCSSLKSICIPSSVRILCESCFSQCQSLSTLSFESNSKLDRIEAQAFSECSSLKSIFIPSSVRILCESCFRGCQSLSTLTFESNSILDRIEARAFYQCSSLKLICIPSYVAVFGGEWCDDSVSVIR